jgi:hypothetical protein
VMRNCPCQGCQMVYFQPKIPIWVNFGRSCNGRCWHMCHLVYLRPFGIFYNKFGIFVGQLVYFSRFGIL